MKHSKVLCVSRIKEKPMKINLFLIEKKPEILKKWFDLILETYPPETARFLQSQKNRFANPVGHTISEGIESIFEEFLQGMNSDKISPFLDNIIRIRAIQNFPPSQALSFIFLLKKVIREELADDIREHRMFEELLTLESRIDVLSGISFDIYMKCREKLYELKANELKSLTYKILQRPNTATEVNTDETKVAGL